MKTRRRFKWDKKKKKGAPGAREIAANTALQQHGNAISLWLGFALDVGQSVSVLWLVVGWRGGIRGLVLELCLAFEQCVGRRVGSRELRGWKSGLKCCIYWYRRQESVLTQVIMQGTTKKP
jgi:hypothetical protein